MSKAPHSPVPFQCRTCRLRNEARGIGFTGVLECRTFETLGDQITIDFIGP